jgi:putative ABC transport system permease protein
MDASVVFCVVCQTYTYYTTEAFLWDFVHRHLRTRFSPALLGVWDCFNQVSQIGQLKTIGMTEKQIKRMIRKEGYRFCLFGIPAGITVGIIFAYLLEPNGITIINAIATSIFAIILGIIIVQISVYKPAQIASNISPIEATKYVGNDPELKESRVRNRKNHIRLSPYSLAVLSEKQNRKKHNLTIASLAIGGILFMVGATFISSWNPDSFARMGNLEDGEYYITINHNTLVNPKPYGISEYQVGQCH